MRDSQNADRRGDRVAARAGHQVDKKIEADFTSAIKQALFIGKKLVRVEMNSN